MHSYSNRIQKAQAQAQAWLGPCFCYVCILLLTLLGIASPARAQGMDPRWMAWRGCWEPVVDAGSASAGRLVCVAPAGESARVFTIAGGAVVARETIEPADAPRAVTREGCTGTERVTWSADGTRLFRTAELDCQGGRHESVSQVLAITRGGEWLDVQGVAIAGAAGVRSQRLREAGVPAGVPDEVTAALEGGTNQRARIAASAPPSVDDVVEASHQVGTGVVEAWLAETGEPFALDGKQITALSRAGVAGSVIDVMVALSYPRAFALHRGAGPEAVTDSSLKDAPGTFAGVASLPVSSSSAYGENICYDRRAYVRGFCYNAIGFGADGYFFNGAFFFNRQPVIIVPSFAGGGTNASEHGRVVKGEGYHPGPGAISSGVTANPRTNPNGSMAGRESGGTVAGSGSAGAAGSGASSAPASAPASGERTAVPRP